MGFYQKEPVDPAKITITYLWTGLGVSGVFVVEVQGDAQNHSYTYSTPFTNQRVTS